MKRWLVAMAMAVKPKAIPGGLLRNKI